MLLRICYDFRAPPVCRLSLSAALTSVSRRRGPSSGAKPLLVCARTLAHTMLLFLMIARRPLLSRASLMRGPHECIERKHFLWRQILIGTRVRLSADSMHLFLVITRRRYALPSLSHTWPSRVHLGEEAFPQAPNPYWYVFTTFFSYNALMTLIHKAAKAYKTALKKQLEHALTDKEKYFAI